MERRLCAQEIIFDGHLYLTVENEWEVEHSKHCVRQKEHYVVHKSKFRCGILPQRIPDVQKDLGDLTKHRHL